MKVLLVNGSPHERGCTYTALREAADAIEKRGIETEILWLGKGEIPGCMGCGACRKLGKCVRNDIVNETAAKLGDYDALIVGSPVCLLRGPERPDMRLPRPPLLLRGR